MHLPRAALFCLLPATLVLFACNSAGPAATPGPEILSVTPAPGAVGVRPDASLEVSFSQPMDRASVEAAYASFSEGLRRDQVTFRWNANSTKVTVDPNAELPITDAPAPALTSSFLIGSSAVDANGRRLAVETAVSFQTARRHTATLAGQAGLDGYTSVYPVTRFGSGGAVGGPIARAGGMTDELPSTGSATVSVRAFLSFDLAVLPAVITPEDVTAASLGVEQVQVYPTTAYADMTTAGEKLILEHVTYGDSLTPTDFATPALGVVSTSFFANATLERRTADVLAQVRDDLGNRAARGARAQFRLRFPKDDPEGNYGFAAFATSEDAARGPSLTLTYLAP